MKVKNVNLVWNVLNWDFNSGKVVTFNIFGHDFCEDIYKRIRKGEIKSFQDLKDRTDKWAMYNYWSRTEYEMLVGGLFNKDELEKIDVYKQIKMNLDLIAQYVVRMMEIEF